MVNPAMPAEWTGSLGECTEMLAEKYGIGRQAQDEYALASHQKAAAAWAAGAYDAEVVPLAGVDLGRDESVRADSSLAALAALKPAFRPDGTITAGNASPLNDGAAALLIGDEAGADAGRPAHRWPGSSPRAWRRWNRSSSASGRSRRPSRRSPGPAWAGIAGPGRAERGVRGPVAGLPGRLAGAGPGQGQRARRGDRASATRWAAPGARILGHLAHALHARGGGYGLAAICIGVGQGLAVVLEAC